MVKAIDEQYQDGEITFEQAGDICYKERNLLLHKATSYRSKDRDETLNQRARFFYQAEQVWDTWIKCYAIMSERYTPQPLQELKTGEILHSNDGQVYKYGGRTPSKKWDGQVLHRALNPRVKLAHENFAYLRLDDVIRQLEERGFKR